MDPKEQPEEQTTNEEPEKEITERELRDRLMKEEAAARAKRMEYLKSIDPSLPEKVAQWKRDYPYVGSVHIQDQLYIFRAISRAEYLAIATKIGDQAKIEEALASKGLLWPPINTMEWVTMPAGIPFTLSQLVQQASGFQPDETLPIRL